MDPRDRKIIEETTAQFLANVVLVKIKQECAESFFLNAIEALGLQGTSGKSLMDDLRDYQAQELNKCLATVSDDQPAVATELRRILSEELERLPKRYLDPDA